MLTDVAVLLGGFVVLAVASDHFVDGAVGIARRIGISTVVVGAVVIGLGTSLPELAVSVLAAVDGDAALGVGNIIGSNIANVGLVLGVAALITPIAVSSSVLRREAPLSTASVLAFAVVVWLGLPLAGGIVLLAALGVVLVVVVRSSSRATSPELAREVEDQARRREGTGEAVGASAPRLAVVTVAGLVGTVLGAQLLVDSARSIAAELGLSDGFVGVTLLAVGTSLPELVTAAQAARRGEDELIVGNVVGSNVFNSLLVGGAVAVVAPGRLSDPALTVVGATAMVAVSVLALVVMARSGRITRVGAATLLVAWLASVALVA